MLLLLYLRNCYHPFRGEPQQGFSFLMFVVPIEAKACFRLWSNQRRDRCEPWLWSTQLPFPLKGCGRGCLIGLWSSVEGGGSYGSGTGVLLTLQIAVPGEGSMHMLPPLHHLELKCPVHAFRTALPSWRCWAQPFCGGNSSPLC